ncbi:synaptotagmin-3-like isoform X1 [Hibiscus syriacus]|uniref:Synaptotagmin-3-like isoform X1 n=1 Tax=Hibiscus syriacus TaxID=106335 RepID=A0A6A2YW37_HIBSY|nr:synaptotagmin-3-like isoform X1 [Hibiscus syriacus]
MGGKWRKAKLALGLNLCAYLPRTLDDDDDDGDGERLSDAALLPPSNWENMVSSSHGLRLSKSTSKSPKMEQGGGHAIFTAECSHSFHFHCIASNVKHDDRICPVCGSKWNEIPIRSPGLDPLPGRASMDAVAWTHNDALMAVVHWLPMTHWDVNRQHVVPVSTVLRSCTYDDFTVLVHLKAAAEVATRNPSPSIHYAGLLQSQNHRAPVDLVTVLDISTSISGTKLALLKRAMGFLIQNLGSNDRHSVIAFSSSTRRLFLLRRIRGLQKSEKVMEDRTEKNPVASIILLSDVQDTCTVYGTRMNESPPNYELLVPPSMHDGGNSGFRIPVHAFGFGADHDASLRHSISEISGRTFSFVKTETIIQDCGVHEFESPPRLA